MQQNLSLGIPMRALFVIASGLLMLPQSAKAHYFLQNIIDNGDVNFNQELAINNAGVIAGCCGDGAVAPNNGHIVGFYVNAAGQTIGFVGIQNPEPSSLTLLGIGAILVALGYKRRRDHARSTGYSISRFAQTDVSNATDPQIHERIGGPLMR
jgi:hypothetical protein